MSGRLIVFAGLPGTGKSTLARMLAEALPAFLIRIDTIEQAFLCGNKKGRNKASSAPDLEGCRRSGMRTLD